MINEFQPVRLRVSDWALSGLPKPLKQWPLICSLSGQVLYYILPFQPISRTAFSHKAKPFEVGIELLHGPIDKETTARHKKVKSMVAASITGALFLQLFLALWRAIWLSGHIAKGVQLGLLRRLSTQYSVSTKSAINTINSDWQSGYGSGLHIKEYLYKKTWAGTKKCNNNKRSIISISISIIRKSQEWTTREENDIQGCLTNSFRLKTP